MSDNINTCTCLICAETFTADEFFDHAATVHGVDLRTTKGQKKMISHMDAREWYQTDYHWTVGDLVFSQSVRMARRRDDMMRFA